MTVVWDIRLLRKILCAQYLLSKYYGASKKLSWSWRNLQMNLKVSVHHLGLRGNRDKHTPYYSRPICLLMHSGSSDKTRTLEKQVANIVTCTQRITNWTRKLRRLSHSTRGFQLRFRPGSDRCMIWLSVGWAKPLCGVGRWDYLLAACTGADTMPKISPLLRSIDVCTLQCIMTLSGLAGTKVSEMGEVGEAASKCFRAWSKATAWGCLSLLAALCWMLGSTIVDSATVTHSFGGRPSQHNAAGANKQV